MDEDDIGIEDTWYCTRCKKEFPDDKVLPTSYDGCAKCPVCKKLIVR
jgi:NAD-dependent SIR2 family protein deacetylase